MAGARLPRAGALARHPRAGDGGRCDLGGRDLGDGGESKGECGSRGGGCDLGCGLRTTRRPRGEEPAARGYAAASELQLSAARLARTRSSDACRDVGRQAAADGRQYVVVLGATRGIQLARLDYVLCEQG